MLTIISTLRHRQIMNYNTSMTQPRFRIIKMAVKFEVNHITCIKTHLVERFDDDVLVA